MRKIIITLLLLTMGISSLGIGCSNKNSSSTSSSSKSSHNSSTSNESDANSSDEDLSSNKKIDGDFIWQDDEYIIGLSEEGKKQTNVVIPKNCKGILCSITDASKGDFNSNKNIKSISFESEEITELPDSFLLNDTNLENIELPKKLESIPKIFASNCSIKSINIPNTVKEIGKQAFSGTLIEEMVIPEGVTTVDDAVFLFTPIKKLYLPESLNEIDSGFLRDIYNLDENGKKLYDLEVYVKEGSYADQHFSDYENSSTIKKYY